MPKKQTLHTGIKIKRIRGYKGITQQQLAEAIGKTRALVSFFERTGQVNKYTLQDIAVALNVSFEEIENVDATTQTTKNADLINLPQPNITEQLKNENEFLKETINHQWLLLNELSKKIPSLKKV